MMALFMEGFWGKNSGEDHERYSVDILRTGNRRTEGKGHMPDRKELKRRGRQIVHRHYLLLVAACLIAAFMGVEFNGATGFAEARTAVRKTENAVAESGTDAAPGVTGVWLLLAEGDLTKGTVLADDYVQDKLSGSSSKVLGFTLGHSRGILAQVVNLFGSGDILVWIWSGINHIVRSEDLTSGVFIGLSLMFFLFVKENISRIVF